MPTPGTLAISAPHLDGSREKRGTGEPGCMATSPLMRPNVSATISFKPPATENRPIMPMIATVRPTSDKSDRIGRLIKLRTANFNISRNGPPSVQFCV